LDGGPRRALAGGDAERLRAVRALALQQPEIIEAWYRLPNPGDGGDMFTLERGPPDWRLSPPRIRGLIPGPPPPSFLPAPFAAHRAGLLGEHGGPAQRAIAILVTGGDPRLRASPLPPANAAVATNPDLGVTAAWLLGVRQPRFTSGRQVGDGLRGRVLREA